LVAQPRDARGWALLAQSYAFVANPAGAESAVQRAVALGVDEQTLRDQVRRAERSSPPQDWVQELIRRKPGQ
jgi:cytochrome c-type biogenesis protein CcmH/NrfG